MSRYIFSKNNRWYISEVFDPSDSKLQEKASYYTLTDDVTGPYYAVGTSDSASIGVSYVPVVKPAGADVTLGVVDSQGRFQALKFNGTQASNSGSAVEVQNYKTWNSTLPSPAPSGASMDFYKCSYINSDSWGGYKAILVEDHYEFESNSTTGLIKPELSRVSKVGDIYLANGLGVLQLITATGFPTYGLIFYAPLTSNIATAETGQSLNIPNGVTFDSSQGALINSYGDQRYISFTASYSQTSFPQGNNPVTISFWYKGADQDDDRFMIGYGDTPYYAGLMFGVRMSYGICHATSWAGQDDVVAQTAVNDNSFHHILVCHNTSTAYIYIDGQQEGSGSFYTNISGTSAGIGAAFWGGYSPVTGNFKAVRFYNRMLEPEQIAALAGEFN